LLSYPNDFNRTLSQPHRRMLYEESGIDPDVALERGYYTARGRSEVPETFKDYQRKPGLVVPMFSPDGETLGYQLRPDKPRKDKKGKPLKYETPGGSDVIIDVHPRMREEARSGSGDLWVTEGIKKADALTSRGLCAVGLIGVWNFQRGGEMLPCWNHINPKRRVRVVYDNDVMVKEGVQLALERLVGDLEDRGAAVEVVYLPDGPLKGVDDYLAAGHTVAELKMLARKFEPGDVSRIRLSRDEKLGAAVEDLERRFWSTEWKGVGAHSARDVALKLIEAAKRHGKVHADGLRVVKAQGPLAVESRVSSRTLWKSLNRLEEMGFGYRDNKGRKEGKSGAFVLRASVRHKGGGNASEEKATKLLQGTNPTDLHLRAPRLMWSRPKFTPKRGTVADTRRVRESKTPQPRDRIERLGKIRGAILDALDAAGGTATLQEIADTLHRKRARDLRRRNLPALEVAGVLAVEGDRVMLAPDWLDKLEEAREIGGELEAEELARRRYRDKSRAYHARDKAPASSPSAAGLAALQRSHEQRAEHIAEHDEHQASVRAAELEHKTVVKRFVHDRLRVLGRIRLELLQEVLRDEGGTPSYALPAAKSLGCTVERLPEYGNAEFVFAPQEWAA